MKSSKIDDAVFSILFTRQKKLERIALGALPPGALASVTSGLIENHAWASLTALELPSTIRSIDDLEVWRIAMNTAQNLQKLIIRVENSTIAPSAGNGPLYGTTSNTPGALFSTLFPALKETQKDMQLNKLTLRSLTLANTHLFHARHTVPDVMDFSRLVELHLERCLGDEYMLDSLAEHFKASGCALRGFWLTTIDLQADCGLDKFLCSFSGLRKLYIRATGEQFTGFDTSCLESHRHSLEELAIQSPFACLCDPDQSEPREAAPLLRVVAKFPRLKQFGLSAYFSISAEPTDHVADKIRSLLCHPTLQTLRIFNWPSIDPDDMQEASAEEYLEHLGSYIDRRIIKPIVEKNPDQRFPALIIGRSGDYCFQEGHVEVDGPRYFRIGKYDGPDVFRIGETVATGRKLKEVKGLVPASAMAKLD